jgi:hypothetical protein
VRHDDRRGDLFKQAAEGSTLTIRRVLEDRMEGGHRGDSQRIDEFGRQRTVRAAPDPVLVLDRDDVDAAIERASRVDIVGRLVLADPMVDLERVGRRLARWMEGDDLALAGRPGKVMRERRDPAATRRVGRNKGRS